MKVTGEQLLALVPEALPGISIDVKEDFISNKFRIHVSYVRHVMVQLDADLVMSSENTIVDKLAVATQHACDILGEAVRKDVGK